MKRAVLIGRIEGLTAKLALKEIEWEYIYGRTVGEGVKLHEAPIPALTKLYEALGKIQERQRTMR